MKEEIMDEILVHDNDVVVDECLDVPIDNDVANKTVDLYQHWMAEYMVSRDDNLITITKKLHAEFKSDQENIRQELISQFKEELDATSQEQDDQLKEMMEKELNEVRERHKREISQTKKTQWCAFCAQRSLYFCCWNTTYCSQSCQGKDWKMHKPKCRNNVRADIDSGLSFNH